MSTTVRDTVTYPNTVGQIGVRTTTHPVSSKPPPPTTTQLIIRASVTKTNSR